MVSPIRLEKNNSLNMSLAFPCVTCIRAPEMASESV